MKLLLLRYFGSYYIYFFVVKEFRLSLLIILYTLAVKSSSVKSNRIWALGETFNRQAILTFKNFSQRCKFPYLGTFGRFWDTKNKIQTTTVSHCPYQGIRHLLLSNSISPSYW